MKRLPANVVCMTLLAGTIVLGCGAARLMAQVPKAGRQPKEPAQPEPIPELPETTVVGEPDTPSDTTPQISATPVQQPEVSLSRVPSNVQVLTQEDFDRVQPLSLADMLNRRIGSVTVIDTQNNPFQPELSYRGFTVSSLLGLPQGLAVYQNGTRINEPFGDTVQFDLIPEFAIEQVQLMPGSNPIYGLNALGGAIVIDMKDGFSYEGLELNTYGGSFGRVQSTVEYGNNFDNVGIYIGATFFDEDGWRAHSPSQVGQFFADLSYRGERLNLGTNLVLADTDLNGNGASPIELLAVDRAAVFTFPDNTQNRLVFWQGRGNYEVADTVSIQGNTYYRRLNRATLNGDETDIAPCEANPAILCEEDGEGDAIEDLAGNIIPAAAIGPEPFGVFNRSSTRTTGLGGTLQSTVQEDLFDRDNLFIVGTSYDYGHTRFRNDTELGELTPDRTVAGSGIFVGGDEFNTRLRAVNQYLGLYVTDTFSMTPHLDLILSGRYNQAWIDLQDQLGDELTGDHEFHRFNPAVGVVYRPTDDASIFFSYGEANRVPTAAELSCADPDNPCRFPNAFVADPPLNQVVSRTVEGGARGRVDYCGDDYFVWAVAPFLTLNNDDIIFVSSGPVVGSGFFQNAGRTLRLGVEVNLSGKLGYLDWYANYAFVRATFEDALTIRSENNPSANADGEIQVTPGDRIPSIPLHLAKLGATYQLTDYWSVTLESIVSSSRFFRGDEGNDQKPVDGFMIVNLISYYQLSDTLEAFLLIQNLFDTDYETFGIFGETDEVFLREVPGGGTDPRFLGPGAPFGIWFGGRLKI